MLSAGIDDAFAISFQFKIRTILSIFNRTINIVGVWRCSYDTGQNLSSQKLLTADDISWVDQYFFNIFSYSKILVIMKAVESEIGSQNVNMTIFVITIAFLVTPFGVSSSLTSGNDVSILELLQTYRSILNILIFKPIMTHY